MSNATNLLPALPFNCSAPNCHNDTAGDYCALHDAPHVEIECDGDDEESGCHCGTECVK